MVRMVRLARPAMAKRKSQKKRVCTRFFFHSLETQPIPQTLEENDYPNFLTLAVRTASNKAHNFGFFGMIYSLSVMN